MITFSYKRENVKNRQTVVKRLIYEMKAAGHRFPVRGCLLGCRGFAGMLLVYA